MILHTRNVRYGMIEHIALRFDWEKVEYQTIDEVLGLNGNALKDGAASWDSVALCTQLGAVILTVDPDTDQIIVSLENCPTGNNWSPISNFEFAKSKPLGWCWVGMNYRGYRDSFTLAFGDGMPDALQPRCTFVAAASSLSCFDLSQQMA